jgi:ABC-type sugar transport system substrate-binding protein
MLKTVAGIAALAAALVMVALSGATASAAPEPAACQNDSKLVGHILLSTDDAPDTWWGITKAGLEAAGIVGDDAQKASIESAFGTTFATLDDAVAAVVDAVRPLDKNGNGFVCASSSRGTMPHVADPNANYYYFGVIDDKHVKS